LFFGDWRSEFLEELEEEVKRKVRNAVPEMLFN
jgi:hypothetical protein